MLPRLSATRLGAASRDRSAGRGLARRALVTCRPSGRTTSSSPSATRPETSVPVTTDPNPFTVKARSTGSRTTPSRPRRGAAPALAVSARVERSETLARARRHRHDRRRRRQKAAGDERRERRATRSSTVSRSTRSDLRERDDAALDPEQPADVEMLARLRHDGLVGGHDEQDGVDAAGAGEHVAHEALVARDVDERQRDVVRLEVREPEIDRDAARLLFLQPIGIGPGQRLDERALAVIDVPGRADDDRSSSRPGQRLPRRRCRVRCRAGPVPARAGRPASVVSRSGRLASLALRLGAADFSRPPVSLRPSRTASRISVSPRSICRRSSVDANDLHRDAVAQPIDAAVASRRAARARVRRTGSSRRPSSRRAPCLRRSARRAR